jgi:hypothetical protein
LYEDLASLLRNCLIASNPCTTTSAPRMATDD